MIGMTPPRLSALRANRVAPAKSGDVVAWVTRAIADNPGAKPRNAAVTVEGYELDRSHAQRLPPSIRWPLRRKLFFRNITETTNSAPMSRTAK